MLYLIHGDEGREVGACRDGSAVKASLTNKKAMTPELTDSASPACQFALRILSPKLVPNHLLTESSSPPFLPPSLCLA